MQSQDLYLLTQDPSGKSSEIVSHHRVWAVDKFMAAQRSMFEKKRGTPDFRSVSITNESAYRKFMNYKEA